MAYETYLENVEACASRLGIPYPVQPINVDIATLLFEKADGAVTAINLTKENAGAFIYFEELVSEIGDDELTVDTDFKFTASQYFANIWERGAAGLDDLLNAFYAARNMSVVWWE